MTREALRIISFPVLVAWAVVGRFDFGYQSMAYWAYDAFTALDDVGHSTLYYRPAWDHATVGPARAHSEEQQTVVSVLMVPIPFPGAEEDLIGGGILNATDGRVFEWGADDLLGGGHFSLVYKARERENPNNFIAVKRIRSTLEIGDEKGALQALGIFQGEDAEKGLLGMPFYDGITLAQLLKEGLSDELRASLLAKALDAVHELHRKGFVHRDLKPENLMISHDRQSVYILDYSLAEHIPDPSTDDAASMINIDLMRVTDEFHGRGLPPPVDTNPITAAELHAPTRPASAPTEPKAHTEL